MSLETKWARRSFLAVAALALAALVSNPSPARCADGAAWIATWGASPQIPSGPPFGTGPLVVQGQTIRQVAHLSKGGDVVRVRFSNAFGSTSLPITEAHVALSAGGSSTVAGTDRTLTFGGSPTTHIPAGALVVSDPVSLRVADLANVTVSLWFPGMVTATTEHSLSVQTTWVSPAGNFAADTTFPAASATSLHWYFLNGVEVASRQPKAAAVVALGDSITDGFNSTVDANRRWPNDLAARLLAWPPTRDVAVVDEGISGNRVLHDVAGPNALARLDRDVLAQSGARWVIVLEGINDIGFPGAFGSTAEFVSADEIIEGHEQIIARAHAKGLRIFGGTLTPFEGTVFPGYFSPAGEVIREAVNAWIRTSGAYDAVIDFDAAVRDPAHPTRMLPAFDSGDHLHPNDAGYQAMANAIDLKLFQGD